MEDAIAQWCEDNGFVVHKYESKAKWQKRGYYTASDLPVGHPDLAGTAPGGFAAYIEVKARGKRSALKPSQRAFLEEMIKCGAFGCVADRVDQVEEYWGTFQMLVGVRQRALYLQEQLPK